MPAESLEWTVPPKVYKVYKERLSVRVTELQIKPSFKSCDWLIKNRICCCSGAKK